jgi:hypothetical protein
MFPRYTLRTARNFHHFARIDDICAVLPAGTKIGAPEGINGDRRVYFPATAHRPVKLYGWIESRR